MTDGFQAFDGGGDEVDDAVVEALQGVSRSEPEAGDGLAFIMDRLLPSGCGTEKKSGVEAPRRTYRRHPMAPREDVIKAEMESLLGEDVGKQPSTRMHVAAVSHESPRHLRLTEIHGMPLIIVGHQQPRLLKGFAHRRHPKGHPAGGNPQQAAQGGVIAPATPLRHFVAGVVRVHRTAREHVGTTHERRRQTAPQHGHLYPGGAIAHHHHRGRRPDRHLIWIKFG